MDNGCIILSTLKTIIREMSMIKIYEGERISQGAEIHVGCAGLLFDENHEKFLLTKRADNGQWCIPGGHMEPGESVAETVIREILEETGLEVEIVKLIGVYSSPHIKVEYQPGQSMQPVVFNFELRQVGGELGTSDEVTEYGFFSLEELENIDFMSIHKQRIIDALANSDKTFIR